MDEMYQALSKIRWEAASPVAESNGDLTVRLPGGRTQKVRVSRQGTSYFFTSIVAARRILDGFTPDRLAAVVWQRNHAGEVVAFGLDGRGRLIGKAEMPASMLSVENVHFYVERIASECDRLEYLLSGRDHE